MRAPCSAVYIVVLLALAADAPAAISSFVDVRVEGFGGVGAVDSRTPARAGISGAGLELGLEGLSGSAGASADPFTQSIGWGLSIGVPVLLNDALVNAISSANAQYSVDFTVPTARTIDFDLVLAYDNPAGGVPAPQANIVITDDTGTAVYSRPVATIVELSVTESLALSPGTYTLSAGLHDSLRFASGPYSSSGSFSYVPRSSGGLFPADPLLPDGGNPTDGWLFEPIIVEGAPTWFDLEVAIGYEYVLNDGPNVASVTLPGGLGDDLYDPWLFDAIAGDWVDSGTDLAAGVEHTFAPGGTTRFRILGIKVKAALDPEDPTAFVTGLTFAGGGPLELVMTPISATVVPLPPGIVLAAPALAALVWGGRRRREEARESD